MRSLVRKTMIVFAVAGYAVNAPAADFQPSTTVLSDDNVYNVKADGSFTQDQTRSIRIETGEGVKDFGQIPYRYSNALESFDVVEAYTTTRDGKRIDVSPDAILTQQSPESAYAPTFDDGRVKTIVFPGVQVGATITMHTRKTQLKPLFPGQFSITDAFWDNKVFESAKVTVIAPASIKLYTEAIDMQGGLVVADDNGKQMWQWSIKDTQAHPPELGAPSIVDHSPRLIITTFPNYEAMGRAYVARANQQAAVTPGIQELADEVTTGMTDRRDQANAIYLWVSNNIRYVAIYLGFGGVVPHSAQAVLDARYGDCKDHTTLLEALLAAKGIKSSVVLVNADNRYWLPKVADPLAVFNHAITYIPEFDVYVDSTAGMARFGVLPSNEDGKSALATDNGSGGATLVTLPLRSPATDRVSVQSEVVFDSEGTARGTSQIDTLGEFDWIARSVFALLRSGTEPAFAERMLTMTGADGSGRYIHGDLRNLKDNFGYATKFKLPDYAQFPGPGAMRVPQGLTSFTNIASTFELVGPNRRRFPLLFSGRHISETTTIDLPEMVKVSSLPKPAQVTSTFGTYMSSYAASGRIVTVTRVLDITMRNPYVEPDQWQDLRKMAVAIKHDLAAQIVY
jgi:transglutaminase-like putative cysteine protease